MSKLKFLTYLSLSSDFEVNADDTVHADQDMAWFLRCYTRRLHATQLLLPSLPNLKECEWLQLRVGRLMSTKMLHPFVVEERPTGLEGTPTRVVRGVKQYWMGMNHEDWVGNGGIVHCKIEDLPGDVIGENEEEEEL